MKRQLVDPHKAEWKQREIEFAYTTCVQNLETSLENLDGLRDTARYLFKQSPADHPSTHAHYQDILYALRQQEEGLHRIQDIFRTSFWTPTLWHRHPPKCPLVPPLGVSPIGLNLIGTPQTTRVGYTFPPLTLGFQNGQNKPSWNMEKKNVYFFNSPRNTRVTSGETSR